MSIREAYKSFWSWALHGWSQREAVLRLCDAFDVMPSQEKELRETITELKRDLIESQHREEIAQEKLSLTAGNLAQCKSDLDALQDKYQKLLIRREAPEEREARDKLHLAILEIESLKQRQADMEKHAAKQVRIIESLWKFIHTAHRLNQEAMPGTLRQLLQQAQK